ncbi:hypothetical protein LJC03_03270 [Methanobrevibacter sp. OttesenSCG-928-I08]|nr:hypothetical protein [Methanobrevibacter sp. OttesenSCG-928-I08]
MVRCSRCGHENNDAFTYCIECNYPLNSKKKQVSEKKDFFTKWENFSTGKKVLFAVCICIIFILTFSTIHSLNNGNDNFASDIATSNTSSTLQSSSPYQVKVIYNGSWSGQVGTFEYPFDRSGSGNALLNVDGASWDNVTATITKHDDNEKNLTVQIIKNNKVIKQNSTTKPNGVVSLTD